MKATSILPSFFETKLKEFQNEIVPVSVAEVGAQLRNLRLHLRTEMNGDLCGLVFRAAIGRELTRLWLLVGHKCQADFSHFESESKLTLLRIFKF